MKFRFICLDSSNFVLLGTNDEARAREWAEEELVYDTETSTSLNADGEGNDQPLSELED